jgi:putative ABC transport system permease protein
LLCQTQQPIRTVTFVLRTSGQLGQIAPQVRRVVAESDGSLPVFAVRTGPDLVAASIAPQRFNMFVVAVFAAVALCLAVTGLYAVMAFIAAQSAREFGIRIAIGATAAGVVRLMLARASWLIVTGVLVGTAISAGLARLVASLLFGMQPNDPVTIAAVAVLLLVVSLAAVMVPALRAGRADPTTCLRSE